LNLPGQQQVEMTYFPPAPAGLPAPAPPARSRAAAADPFMQTFGCIYYNDLFIELQYLRGRAGTICLQFLNTFKSAERGLCGIQENAPVTRGV
jgi:hypothetical protein